MTMGREIRRVPPDWEHPTYTGNEWPRQIAGSHRPIKDEYFVTAGEAWLERVRRWEAGEDPDRATLEARLGRRAFLWEWDSENPDPDSYRDRAWTPEEATHYQVYETVTEGTPESPVFATLAEVEAWLIGEGVSPAAARAFCEEGWAPSMVLRVGPEGTTVTPTYEALPVWGDR